MVGIHKHFEAGANRNLLGIFSDVFLLIISISFCRQVEDIKMVLEGTVKPTTVQLDAIRNISSSADLIEQCAGDNKLAKVCVKFFLW